MRDSEDLRRLTPIRRTVTHGLVTQREPEKNHLWVDGSVSYFGIPAVDANQSAAFHASVFGWSVRGGVSFDDARGHLSGFFTTGQKPSREAGLRPSFTSTTSTTRSNG